MLIESVADRDKTAARGHKVVEVDGAMLVLDKFRNDNRQHRASDNPGLDESAGVQPDNGGAVENRIEVIGARVFIDWIAAPHNRLESADVNRLPLCDARGMR